MWRLPSRNVRNMPKDTVQTTNTDHCWYTPQAFERGEPLASENFEQACQVVMTDADALRARIVQNRRPAWSTTSQSCVPMWLYSATALYADATMRPRDQ